MKSLSDSQRRERPKSCAKGTKNYYSSLVNYWKALLLSLSTIAALAFSNHHPLAATVYGTDEMDHLYSLVTDDILIGKLGDDRYFIDSLNDVIVEKPNEGYDLIRAPITPFTLNIPNVELYQYQGVVPFVGYGSDEPNHFLMEDSAIGDNRIETYGGDDVLEGGVGSDTFLGGDGYDILLGRGGDDILFGESGPDSIDGESGDDFADGGEGDDNINGNHGSDRLIGGDGNDYILGGRHAAFGDATDGIDTIDGGDGDDYMEGGADNDTISGGAGADSLVGGLGADNMVGGLGQDRYFVNNVNDEVIESPEVHPDYGLLPLNTFPAGDMVLVENLSTYTLAANVEILSLNSNVSNNFVGYGNGSDNFLEGTGLLKVLTLYGLEGNDTLAAGNGTATLIGGPGDDIYAAYSPDVTVIEEPNGGTDQLWISEIYFTVPAPSAYSLPANIEVMYIQKSDQVIVIGNDEGNSISGTQGNDAINGNGGSDTLVGDKGNDILTGDTLQTSQPASISTFGVISAMAEVAQLVTPAAATISGNDLIDGGLGSDIAQFSGRSSEYSFSYNASARTYTITDKVADRDGSDTVKNVEFFKFTDGTKSATDIGLSVTGDAGPNTINGSPASDQLFGLVGNDKLNGYAGDDELDGGAGADIMSGGDGNDSYIVDNAGDKVKETSKAGGGTDTVYTSLPSYTLPLNVENLVYTGTSNFSGKGNKSSNRLYGGPAADKLDGQKGVDVMVGGAGDDTYVVDSTSDLVNEDQDAGFDQVTSSVTITTLSQNVEVLTLSKGNVNGTGNALDNMIIGSTGLNILSGGDGADTFIGGMGNDTFYGETAASLGDDADTISFSGAKKGVIFSLANTLAGQNTGGAGTDRIYDISGIENLTGTSFPDNLTGSAISNVIRGSDGNDLIYGLIGPDILYGDAGLDSIDCGADTDMDRVAYIQPSDSPVGENRDQVTNFSAENDLIELSLMDADVNAGGDQPFAFSSTTPQANSVWYLVSGEDVIVQGDVNGDAVADFEVLVKSVASVAENNFAL